MEGSGRAPVHRYVCSHQHHYTYCFCSSKPLYKGMGDLAVPGCLDGTGRWAIFPGGACQVDCGHTVADFIDSTEKQFKVESGKLHSLLFCCLHSLTAWNDFWLGKLWLPEAHKTTPQKAAQAGAFERTNRDFYIEQNNCRNFTSLHSEAFAVPLAKPHWVSCPPESVGNTGGKDHWVTQCAILSAEEQGSLNRFE